MNETFKGKPGIGVGSGVRLYPEVQPLTFHIPTSTEMVLLSQTENKNLEEGGIGGGGRRKG